VNTVFALDVPSSVHSDLAEAAKKTSCEALGTILALYSFFWEMPRFYFDIRHGDSVAPDEEGMECADLPAAEREANLSVVEVALDLHRDNQTRELSVDVRSEAGQRLLVITLSLKISRELS